MPIEWTDITGGTFPEGVWDDTRIWLDEGRWEGETEWTLVQASDPSEEAE